MKNTDNLFMASIALAIALFASVQVTAMESGRKVNPHLTKEQATFLEDKIEKLKNHVYFDPKSPLHSFRRDIFERISILEAIYYGNESYTNLQFYQKLPYAWVYQ